MSVLIGQPGPDFTAPAAFPSRNAATPIRTINLADYTGRWLIFLWYPDSLTFVCPTEILAFSNRLDKFTDSETDALAASVDSVYSHRAWASTPRKANDIQGVRFPIVPNLFHTAARAWGVLLENVMQYAALHNLNAERAVDETLLALAALQLGGLCGSDWRPRRETLRP